MRKIIVACNLLLAILTACGPALKAGSSMELATSTENAVSVDVSIEIDLTGQAWLAATFRPAEPDIHLYSKDIPRDGVDGLGRPTLLELIPGSRIQGAGSLIESVSANEMDVDGLSIYPAGPVTLRLPIILPEEDGWFDENVSITYMACGNGSCRPPVIGKIVSIRVPGADYIFKP